MAIDVENQSTGKLRGRVLSKVRKDVRLRMEREVNEFIIQFKLWITYCDDILGILV